MNPSEFELYGWNTPNGQKIIIALEEVGAPYNYKPIDISQGEQHEASFRAVSPDGKIPALIHHKATPIALFESGAILLYLASVFPQLNGDSEADRAQIMSWTFWQAGQLGPLAGQFGRFHALSPHNTQAINHFEELIWRCLEVMEKQLAQSTYLASEQLSVADIACFPWIASNQSYLQRYDLHWRERCPAVTRWADNMASRTSVIKALAL